MRELTNQELDTVSGGLEVSEIPGAIAIVGLLGSVLAVGTALVVGFAAVTSIKDFFGLND